MELSKKHVRNLLVGSLLIWLYRRSSTPAPQQPLPSGEATVLEEGVASFYGPRFDGKLTASGEVFNQNALTAAHRTLRFGTLVKVTDLDNGRSVVVRINDRGPFTKSPNGNFARCIDLSVGAAAAIGLDIQRGLARVRLERV